MVNGDPISQGYRGGKQKSKLCLHLKRDETLSRLKKLNRMEFCLCGCWERRAGGGDSLPGDWNESHLASGLCLCGAVIAR